MSSKPRIPIVTILVAIMAFSGGVVVSPYLLSLGSTAQQQVVTTVITTVPTSMSQTSVSQISSSSTQVQQATSAAQKPKWTTPSTNVVSWSQAASYVGQTKTVEGTIVYVGTSGGTVFLDFHYPYQGYFYGVIFSSDVSNFRCSPAQFYYNKEVRITGYIQPYKGTPEIIVRSPSQIEVAYVGFPCS